MTQPPKAGVVQAIAPGIRAVLAPNPSPMTYWGTNSFLIGEGGVAVLDPGPALPAHHDALLAALAPGERITHILVSHAHMDHSPLARPLAETTGAPVLAYGDATAGQSDLMRALAARGLTAGGEGVDIAFAPDETLPDGARIDIGALTLEALWTPGHFGNHLAFALDDIIFTADIVMGWASTLISPPDGDLTAFRASCQRLAQRGARQFLPAHGAPIDDPAGRIAWLLAHRDARETAILDALASAPRTIPQITAEVYTDTPATLMPAAERNVFAHLIDLTTRGRTTATPEIGPTATYARV